MEETQSGSDWGDDRSLKTAESLREFREQAEQTLGEHRERACGIETRLNEQLELVAEELARERLTDEQTVAASTEQTALLERVRQTLVEKEAALAEKEIQVEEVLEQLAEQSLDFEALLAERDEELELVLELGEEESQQRATLEQEIDQLQQESEQNEQQLEKIRRKFELALADVHKLKRENAELHEELLSRPKADDQESPELVSLRAERDALAQRVSELENAPAPAEPADGQQELEDLQRRFEMAVDDVRQFKQENAKLQQQWESAQQAAATTATTPSKDEPPGGAMDWQAQRARLMAALDAEDQGVVDEQRREELATVEGTILITDRVVAEKDTLLSKREAEVADLQSQLESRPEGGDTEELREQIAAEILGDDEAVQAECTKLKQQQEELDAKLREAELDISVQRATLAREQAALEEKLAKLPDDDSESEKSSTGKPRRRWLSALGLKDEDTEK